MPRFLILSCEHTLTTLSFLNSSDSVDSVSMLLMMSDSPVRLNSQLFVRMNVSSMDVGSFNICVA